jgi:hypothetical protein
MKKLILCLIVCNTVTQILYSQNVEVNRSKEINTFLIERNECIDLIEAKNVRIVAYKEALLVSDSISQNKTFMFSKCDSLNSALSTENLTLLNQLSKTKSNVKMLTGISIVSLIVIVLLAVF